MSSKPALPSAPVLSDVVGLNLRSSVAQSADVRLENPLLQAYISALSPLFISVMFKVFCCSGLFFAVSVFRPVFSVIAKWCYCFLARRVLLFFHFTAASVCQRLYLNSWWTEAAALMSIPAGIVGMKFSRSTLLLLRVYYPPSTR